MGVFYIVSVASVSQYELARVDWTTVVPPPPISNFQAVVLGLNSVTRLALQAINEGELYPNILPNTTLILDTKLDFGSPSQSIAALIDFEEEGYTFITGFHTSNVAIPTGIAATVYGIAQLSSSAADTRLSDKSQYPYFSRMSPGSLGYEQTVVQAILYYAEQTERGWMDVGLMTQTEPSALTTAFNFIQLAGENDLKIASFQQILTGETNASVEVAELQKSGARVIFLVSFPAELEVILQELIAFDMISDEYVYILSATISSIPFSEPKEEFRGAMSIGIHFPTDSPERLLLDYLWNNADPEVYPVTGSSGYNLSPFHILTYDELITAALVLDSLNRKGRLDDPTPIPPTEWVEEIQNVNFVGASGPIQFDENNDRISIFELLYYSPEQNKFIVSALYSEITGYQLLEDIVWYSNTTDIPDLDIREPLDYWSCDKKKMIYDETGKTKLHTPDRGHVNNIDSNYHCDTFIDCQNFSDESVDCVWNYSILFIVFGIITGVFILVTFAVLLFVLVFGVILRYPRLKTLSPTFLVIILISIIIGYSSIYAWFGKPHPVACAFQPWLLGLPIVSMIAALCVKVYRIWRIFGTGSSYIKKITISDGMLFLFWIAIMIPAVLIIVIWSIVSTPTAKMKNFDGEDHYVCATGGFTGDPGGIIFFFIFVAYAFMVLLFGAFLSIVTRKVPSVFNESKLLAISIYNLGFLAVVIIPVYMVVQVFNPFIAWIIRTIAILYAFTATNVLQFLPSVLPIIFIDHLKPVKLQLDTTPASASKVPKLVTAAHFR